MADPLAVEVGIVAALPLELGPFWQRADLDRELRGSEQTVRMGTCAGVRIATVAGGVGAAKAQRATSLLLAGHQPRFVLTVGLSGGLQPDLPAGELVIGIRLQATEAPELTLLDEWPAGAPITGRAGRLWMHPQIVTSPEEKERLGRETGALAVDMESYAVADVCREAGVPCLAVRAISDEMTHPLPAVVNRLAATHGVRQWGTAVGALWKQPALLSSLWDLQSRSSRAAEQLGAQLPRLIPWLVGR
jgi:adenosylhomocysteine nucleosidase